MFQSLVAEVKESSARLTGEAVIEFRNAVTQYMKVYGVSRLELAHRMAVHPSFITKVMKGDMNISMETVAKICHALNCEFEIKVGPNLLAVEQDFSAVKKQLTATTTTEVLAGEGEGSPALFFFRDELERKGASHGRRFIKPNIDVRGIRSFNRTCLIKDKLKYKNRM